VLAYARRARLDGGTALLALAALVLIALTLAAVASLFVFAA
jgi:hypothetical protein